MNIKGKCNNMNEWTDFYLPKDMEQYDVNIDYYRYCKGGICNADGTVYLFTDGDESFIKNNIDKPFITLKEETMVINGKEVKIRSDILKKSSITINNLKPFMSDKWNLKETLPLGINRIADYGDSIVDGLVTLKGQLYVSDKNDILRLVKNFNFRSDNSVRLPLDKILRNDIAKHIVNCLYTKDELHYKCLSAHIKFRRIDENCGNLYVYEYLENKDVLISFRFNDLYSKDSNSLKISTPHSFSNIYGVTYANNIAKEVIAKLKSEE